MNIRDIDTCYRDQRETYSIIVAALNKSMVKVFFYLVVAVGACGAGSRVKMMLSLLGD